MLNAGSHGSSERTTANSDSVCPSVSHTRDGQTDKQFKMLKHILYHMIERRFQFLHVSSSTRPIFVVVSLGIHSKRVC